MIQVNWTGNGYKAFKEKKGIMAHNTQGKLAILLPMTVPLT